MTILLLLAGVSLFIVLYLKRKALSNYLFSTQPDTSADDAISTEAVSDGPAQAAVQEIAMEIDDLQWQLDAKKRDLQQLQTTYSLKNEAAVKLDALEDRMDLMEGRLQQLRQSLAQVQLAAIDMDNLTIARQQLEKQLAQSGQQLQASQTEKEALREQLDDLQDYTTQLKEERLELEKKLRLLENLQNPV